MIRVGGGFSWDVRYVDISIYIHIYIYRLFHRVKSALGASRLADKCGHGYDIP